MKRTLLSIVLSIALISVGHAFNTQVTFNAHSGGKFIIFANGQKMNSRPVRHMSLNHLPAGNNKIRVRYWERGGVRDVWKTIFLRRGFETSFNIRFNQFGELRVINAGSFALRNQRRVPNRGGHFGKSNFQQFLFELERKRFDDQKFNLASRYLSRNDLATRQLIRIVRQFSFDDTKVDFIVNAYPYVRDKQNFSLVYNELRFRSSVRAVKTRLGQVPVNNRRNGRW